MSGKLTVRQFFAEFPDDDACLERVILKFVMAFGIFAAIAARKRVSTRSLGAGNSLAPLRRCYAACLGIPGAMPTYYYTSRTQETQGQRPGDRISSCSLVRRPQRTW